MSLQCLFQLTSTTRVSDRSAYADVRYYMRAYLDETGKVRLQMRDERRSFGVMGNMVAPVVAGVNVPEGFNRVILPPGYHRGQLTLGGFLKDAMILAGYPRKTGRNGLEKSRWIDAVSREWAKLLGKYRSYSREGVLARNNFALSMSAGLSRALTLANVSAPVFLEKVLERAFARYLRENEYANGDELGYVYGFHMDTSNLHIQMSVFPRTRNGAIVRVTEMVRSKERSTSFIGSMTRYACEAAVDLERELLGRSQLGEIPVRELGKNMFRSHRVFSAYREALKRSGKRTVYQDLENRLVAGFLKESGCPGEMMPALHRLVRRYAGGNAGQSKAPVDYESDDAGDLIRRMSRLWLAFSYEELEREELRKAGAKAREAREAGEAGGAGAAGAAGESRGADFPADLVSVYKGFWARALAPQGRESDTGREVSEHLKRKREAAALDIQKELPQDAVLWRAEFSELGAWFDRALLYLDRHLLFGSGVFFSQAGLKELELAVKLRAGAARFLTRDALGLDERVLKGEVPQEFVERGVGKSLESRVESRAEPD